MITRPSFFLFTSLAAPASVAVLALLACGSAHETLAAATGEQPAAAPKSPAANSSADAQTGATRKPAELVDAPLASYRGELLTLAFDTASALPTHPHKKNRCRMQEDVVTTCLSIDQPRRALSYIERIDDWRRGSTYADLAGYLARHGGAEQVDRYLALADEIAEQKSADTKEQGWRPELIKSKIAAVLVEKSPDKETTDVAARIAELDAMVDHGGLEETQRALTEFARLYQRHYADETRRNMLYSKVRNSWKKSPIQIRFDTLMKLSDAALAHEDASTALVLAKETRTMIDEVDFPVEDRLPLVARLADVLRRAGDTAAAKTELESALALYDKNAAQIVDIYRSQALRPLAEQWQKLGDTKQALAIYGRAVEAGVTNPNSRPRADDLQAVCCSLARADVDPGESLMKRLREIRAGLRDPW